MWARYGDELVYSAFHGLMFGMVGDQRLKPLFGYFTDPVSGDILDTWDNPYTGETVEVFNFLNDRIRGELTPEMPRFQFGDEYDAPTLMNDGTALVREDGSVPFILPWQVYGNQVSLAWDYTHRYRNPVTVDKWPKALGGLRQGSAPRNQLRIVSEVQDRAFPFRHSFARRRSPYVRPGLSRLLCRPHGPGRAGCCT